MRAVVHLHGAVVVQGVLGNRAAYEDLEGGEFVSTLLVPKTAVPLYVEFSHRLVVCRAGVQVRASLG